MFFFLQLENINCIFRKNKLLLPQLCTLSVNFILGIYRRRRNILLRNKLRKPAKSCIVQSLKHDWPFRTVEKSSTFYISQKCLNFSTSHSTLFSDLSFQNFYRKLYVKSAFFKQTFQVFPSENTQKTIERSFLSFKLR